MVRTLTFDEVYPTLPVRGWLTEPEARFLWDSANLTTGDILEVGCYYGRSTVLLASLGRQMYCVDPFEGFDTDDPTGNIIHQEFWRNICDLGLQNVNLSRMCIEGWHPKPMGFVYLDGDHTYKGTRSQIDKAVLCNPQLIAIHDVNDRGGGVMVKIAAQEKLGKWSGRVGSLAVWDM